MSNYFLNEQSVLGGLMIIGDLSTEAAQKTISMLKVGSFQDGRHKAIYKTICALENENTTADLIMIDSRLQQSGELDRVGGIAYLAEIMQTVPSAANILNYADLVRQNAIRVAVNSKMQNALAEFNDLDGDNIYQKLGQLESAIAALGERATKGRYNGLTHIKEIGREWFTALQDRQNNPEHHQGLSTGIESLDEALGVKLIIPGSLFVIGARPKAGKSSLVEAIARHNAKQGKVVAMFSLEMPNHQVYERILSAESRVNSNKFHTVDLSEYEWQNTSTAIGSINDTNLYIDDEPGIDLQHVKKESRKLAKEHGGIDLIAVDYLTLMKAGKADRNDLAYGEISKGLKQLAKELDCVVVMLTQLNRNLENRTDKRPIPADSRDTGAIEQDCDYWVGLYREGVYNDDLPAEQKGLTEALIRLNRHGEAGTGYMNLTNGYFINHVPFTFTKEEKKGGFKDF